LRAAEGVGPYVGCAALRVVEDADPYEIASQSSRESAKKSNRFSGDMCGGKTP